MKLEHGLFSRLVRRAKDERGSILVQASLYLAVVLGMTGLAIDGGRFLLLNNSLQDLADAAALAGAAQLDGAQDAQTRATHAAQAIANRNPPPLWYYDTGGSTTITTAFYKSLNPDTVASGGKDSYYIEVTTASSQTRPTFLAAVNVFTRSAVANNATSATAMAYGFGNNLGNCAPTQSFICNPFESTETNPGNANNFSSTMSNHAGRMVHLVNGANAPGNWGLLQPPPIFGNNNPHNQTPFWAENSAGQCITGPNQADTRTGNVAKDAQSGMNVRFDSPIGSGDESHSAPIVIAGFKSGGGSGPNHLNGNSCQHYGNGYSGGGASEISGPNSVTPVYPSNFDPTNYSCPSGTGFSCPLPRDPSQTGTNHMPIVTTNNAAWSQMEIGNGPNLTDLQAYWNNHHGTSTLPAGVNTRWTIYQCELGVGAFNGVSGCGPWSTWPSDSVEPHGPVCTNSTTVDYTRRVTNVAVVDCNYWGITGHSTPIPAASLLAQFFMTEPALDDGSIYGEYIGCLSLSPVNSAGCGGSGTATANGLHSLVQLVR